MNQPIQDDIGECGFIDIAVPVFSGQLRRDQREAFLATKYPELTGTGFALDTAHKPYCLRALVLRAEFG